MTYQVGVVASDQSDGSPDAEEAHCYVSSKLVIPLLIIKSERVSNQTQIRGLGRQLAKRKKVNSTTLQALITRMELQTLP